jgi:hypothetical protein
MTDSEFVLLGIWIGITIALVVYGVINYRKRVARREEIKIEYETSIADLKIKSINDKLCAEIIRIDELEKKLFCSKLVVQDVESAKTPEKFIDMLNLHTQAKARGISPEASDYFKGVRSQCVVISRMIQDYQNGLKK